MAARINLDDPVMHRSNFLQRGIARWAVLAIVAAFFSAGGLAWLWFAQPAQAPEMAFTSLHGEKFSTADLRGKVVLVNFWATSCTICVGEMPHMVETYQRYKNQGLDFIAVAMSYDPPNAVLNFAETRALPFKVALDLKGEAARRFGNVELTPTTFVLDKQGRIIKQYLGEPNFIELRKLIETTLAS